MNHLELYACSGVFIWSVVYSLLRFYQSSQDKLYQAYDAEFEKTETCSFFLTCGRHKDVADLEWQIFKQYFIESKIVVLLLHSIGFYLTRKFIPKYLSTFVILYSSGCIIYLFSPYALLLYYAYIGFTFVLEYLIDYLRITHKPIYHYILFIIWIYLLHGLKVFVDHRKNDLFQICFAWLCSRCLSCTIDIYKSQSAQLDGSKDQESSFHYLSKLEIRLSYFLYLPPFFFGPIYHYENYASYLAKLERNDHPSVDKNLFWNIVKFCRYIGWAWVLEIIVHFIYTSTLQSYVFIIEEFDAWSICGFCFALCIIFFMKYVVLYGVSHTMAEIDGFCDVVAPPPLCTAHINKNSQIWRKFDKGLYLFLIKYFYKPLMGLKLSNLIKRIIATLVIFIIMSIWHGLYKSVIVWVSTNVIISYTETISLELERSAWFSSFENSLSPAAQLRLYAFFGVPLLGLSYLSHVIFLSNIECGMVFLTKVLLQFPIPMLPTFFVLYCVYFVSSYINKRLKIDHK